MGFSDDHFDHCALLKEEVIHLPPDQRRAAFMELAKKIAEDFLHTAKTYDLDDETSESDEPAMKKVKGCPNSIDYKIGPVHSGLSRGGSK